MVKVIVQTQQQHCNTKWIFHFGARIQVIKYIQSVNVPASVIIIQLLRKQINHKFLATKKKYLY